MAFCGVCALYLVLVAPLLTVASADIRLVDVYSADESLAASVVQYLLRTGSFELHHYSYGGLFYYLPLGLLHFVGLFVPASEQMVVVTLRVFGTAAGLACLWLTWRLGRHLFCPTAGFLGSLLLALSATFLRWSVEIHPDLPQLAWLLASIWMCVRLVENLTLKTSVAASIFAGLAFGTKYSGGFLLPLIVLSIWLHPGVSQPRSRRWMTLGVPLVFLAVFLVTNPYVPVRFEQFARDLRFESEHLARGHDVEVARVGYRWWIDLGRLAGAASTIAFVVWLSTLLRDGQIGRRLRSPEGLLLAWIAGYVTFLVSGANLQADRHLLPVLPIVLTLAAGGYLEIHRQLIHWLGRPAPALVLTGALVLWSLGSRSAGAVSFIDARRDLVASSSEVAAGRWLQRSYPALSSVIYDAYSYVPSSFRDAYRSFGTTVPDVYHFDPDLIVVRDAVARRFMAEEDTSRARMGPDAFLDRHTFYRLVSEDRLPGYALAKQFEGVRVLQRTRPEASPEEPSWPERAAMRAGNRLNRSDQARETVGDMLAQDGEWEAAAREYRLGLAARPDSGPMHLKLGHSLIAAGRYAKAEGIIGKLISELVGAPDDQAGVLQYVAHRYYKAGLDSEAIARLERAAKLAPDHPYVTVDLLLLQLAGNDGDRSIEPPTARRAGLRARLDQLVGMGIVGEADAIRIRRRLANTTSGEDR